MRLASQSVTVYPDRAAFVEASKPIYKQFAAEVPTGQALIDAASFSTVRIVSGAVTLALIVLPRWRRHGRQPADWRMASMLFLYVVFFSFAYLSLAAGTGALILFGAVQLTMFIVALAHGESFPLPERFADVVAQMNFVTKRPKGSPKSTTPTPILNC